MPRLARSRVAGDRKAIQSVRLRGYPIHLQRTRTDEAVSWFLMSGFPLWELISYC